LRKKDFKRLEDYGMIGDLSKETENRIVGKIREIRGVKSVRSLLKVAEKK
jgi:osmotically-inducible protein OsmY